MFIRVLPATIVAFSVLAAPVALADSAPSHSAVELTQGDIAIATNTVRNWLVANYMDTLRAQGVDLDQCLFHIAASAAENELVVFVSGQGISGSIVLDAETFEILEDTIAI